jgi:hypothetical protein
MGIKVQKEDKFRATIEKQGFNTKEVVDSFFACIRKRGIK